MYLSYNVGILTCNDFLTFDKENFATVVVFIVISYLALDLTLGVTILSFVLVD